MRFRGGSGARAAVFGLVSVLSVATACSSDGSGSNDNTAGSSGSAGSSASSGTGGSDAGTGGASGAGGGGTAGSGGLCGGSCACNNGLDDDGDGLIDGFDPECTGPRDNDEGSFATGIPGDNRDPKWQDCFFDGNSGAGDDQCRYHTDCLYGVLEPTDPDCQASQACLDFCAPRTPNGCDCFGCCTVAQDDGTTVDIVIGGSCSLETLGDESVCRRCSKTENCSNDCGTCELCPGRTVEDLPPECTPPDTDGGTPPPGYTCDNGQPVCSAEIPCANGYCQLGCCLPVIE